MKNTNIRMIDIHNHILYGLDDGAQTIDDTISMLKQAVDDGIEKVIVTPHYMEPRFLNTKSDIEKKKPEIDQLLAQHNIPIKVYYGSEIFVNDDTLDKLNDGLLQTMNDTKYVLVERKRAEAFSRITFDDNLYNFRVDGYYPIVAHPERYRSVNEDPNKVYEWIKDGCYIQVNASSILDTKKRSHKVTMKLLANHMVQFVATDAHNTENHPVILSEAYRTVSKRFGASYAEKLFYTNPLHVINGEPIDTSDVKPIKKRKFFFF